MGVTFDLVNYAGTGADFPGVYARLDQFSVSLPMTAALVPGISCPVALFYVSIAAYQAGAQPLTVFATGDLFGTFAFPLADGNAMRASLDPQLVAVVEALPGYVIGSAAVVVDPPAP